MKLIIECADKATTDYIVGVLASLQDISKAEINLSIVTDPAPDVKGRVRSPQVRYFSTSPADLPNALLTLGERTIIGILYRDITESTVKAQHVGREALETTRSLAERRHFNQKSLERSLVHLRQAGLVDSERIA